MPPNYYFELFERYIGAASLPAFQQLQTTRLVGHYDDLDSITRDLRWLLEKHVSLVYRNRVDSLIAALNVTLNDVIHKEQEYQYGRHNIDCRLRPFGHGPCLTLFMDSKLEQLVERAAALKDVYTEIMRKLVLVKQIIIFRSAA